MALEITVGPPRLAINQGHSVLITDPDGQIPWPSDKGLYFYRHADGQQLEHLCKWRTLGTAQRR